ncbi:tetratricopeptide repeat domain 26 isoform X2 [Leptinotarsa decemlineata]|uniref:tetratricopeptide repeat domain 26 isoform X2 n=1 Tax=Leptinotarsa decemlineata TaxID=7539 RepID=UPI003D3088B5
MILSRAKPAISVNNESSKDFGRGNLSKNSSQFDFYLQKRDYAGAITLLEYKQCTGRNDSEEQWMAFCAFHRGDYKKALNIYQDHMKNDYDIEHSLLNTACCYFYLGMYDDSKEILKKAPSSGLKIRLNFHLSHKLRDEATLMEYHQQLQDVLEDQLSLAAIHYLRAHYQEAIDIYKRLLLQNRENIALNVYVALCYYKLDYYDVSQEVLGMYLNQYPDSVIATNLKACNTFRLYNGTSAENELRTIIDQSANVGFGYDLLKHNLVVFRDGEGAMQPEHVKVAEECFHLVGSSTSECDTIHGRQCMAAAFFLAGQFEEVLVYLTSIKSYLHSDDTFNFNFAQAKTACNQFKEAEETFLLIQDSHIKNDYVYISNLARCFIMNQKPRQAWELYQRTESGPESFNLLLLIANDCYRMGEFWYAAKAFDSLDKLEPNPEFWEGKRGAIVGVFQGVVAQKFPVDILGDILQLLRSSTSNQADQIANVIRKWSKEKRLSIN